jgi:ribosomal protein S18 acetylase RimI-like enzyme
MKDSFYNVTLEGNVSLKMLVCKKPWGSLVLVIKPVLNTNRPDRRVIGICNVSVEPDKRAEVEYIKVDPQHQRKGIGSSMLQLVTYYLQNEIATEIFADPYAAEDPQIAIKFYRKNGFTIVNEHKAQMLLPKQQNPKSSIKHKLEKITEAEFLSGYSPMM